MKRRMLRAALLGAALSMPLAASANLVVDGGFEAGTVTGDYTTYNATSTMGGWTVAAGSVDLIGTLWQPGGGAQSVDMAGFYQNGTINQTIAGSLANGVYHLTFDMSGNPYGAPLTKTVRVSFGDTTQDFNFIVDGTQTLANMNWKVRSGDFQFTGANAVLQFTDISGGENSNTAFGAAIDNVSLTAVPEPSTVIAGALLLLPFGASALRSFRRKSVA